MRNPLSAPVRGHRPHPACRAPALVHALAWAGILGAAAPGPWSPVAQAASSASWAASEGVSASVGSLSTSVQSLSNSSTRGEAIAQGTYRVVELAPQPGRPDLLALRLERADQAQPQAAGPQAPAAVRLVLPARTVRAAAILAGDAVVVRDLPQGLEFAHGQPARAFFLALREEALGDLRTRPLTL